MKKFTALYAALIVVMFFALGCASEGKSRPPESGYSTELTFPELDKDEILYPGETWEEE